MDSVSGEIREMRIEERDGELVAVDDASGISMRFVREFTREPPRTRSMVDIFLCIGDLNTRFASPRAFAEQIRRRARKRRRCRPRRRHQAAWVKR